MPCCTVLPYKPYDNYYVAKHYTTKIQGFEFHTIKFFNKHARGTTRDPQNGTLMWTVHIWPPHVNCKQFCQVWHIMCVQNTFEYHEQCIMVPFLFVPHDHTTCAN